MTRILVLFAVFCMIIFSSANDSLFTKHLAESVKYIDEHYNDQLDSNVYAKDITHRHYLFFKSIDIDNNYLLDGLEVIKAHLDFGLEHNKALTFNSQLIYTYEHETDAVLEHYDANFDGFISWSEFENTLKENNDKSWW
uniref:EF-hand domain-containing protein n=1 Tax=Rhabditophanes sp. KR3021 TaxID=114890 RepID=A0AC35U2P9_9BILA